MPAVVRSGDINTASAAVTSSRNVNVNSKSITVNGDPVADHPAPRDRTVLAGNSDAGFLWMRRKDWSSSLKAVHKLG